MQTGLIALEIAVRINKLDIDLNSIVREYGIDSNELEKEELVRILKNLDFKVKIKSIDIADTKKYPLPSIFLLKDNAYGVLLKANYDEQKVLIFIPGENKTKEITFAEFRDLTSGELIILIHKMLNSQIKFGFKWFFHEILKFRQVILEVLIGSFVVQLFGLITPLFTQVILDKVIVHHSLMF